MRAIEILKEVETLSHDNLGVGGGNSDMVTITVPRHLLNIQSSHDHGHDDHETCCNECGLYEDDCMCDPEDCQVDEESVEVAVSKDQNELSDIMRLAGGKQSGQNDTIAAPATGELPAQPVMVPPLQQQIELFKQQGGKESPVINQIIDGHDDIIGSTAGEQPEQSIYHDTPLEDNEFVGAGTGAVDVLENSTTTKGAKKPWYKL